MVLLHVVAPMAGKRAKEPTTGEIRRALLATADHVDANPALIRAEAKKVNRLRTAKEHGRDKLAAYKKAGASMEETFERSRAIVSAGLAAADIDPSLAEPPAEWVAELGEEAAWKRFRLAKAAWSPTRDAPHVFAIASQLAAAEARIAAAKGSSPSTVLNVAIQMVMTPKQYEEIEVDGE